MDDFTQGKIALFYCLYFFLWQEMRDTLIVTLLIHGDVHVHTPLPLPTHTHTHRHTHKIKIRNSLCLRPVTQQSAFL